jgi:hypothetical protein
MRVVRVAMLIAVMTGPLAAPAFAQFTPGFKLGEEKYRSEEEIARAKENEDAAKAARAKIPDAKQNADPWATVRPEASAKPKGKSTAKSTAK